MNGASKKKVRENITCPHYYYANKHAKCKITFSLSLSSFVVSNEGKQRLKHWRNCVTMLNDIARLVKHQYIDNTLKSWSLTVFLNEIQVQALFASQFQMSTSPMKSIRVKLFISFEMATIWSIPKVEGEWIFSIQH